MRQNSPTRQCAPASCARIMGPLHRLDLADRPAGLFASGVGMLSPPSHSSRLERGSAHPCVKPVDSGYV